MYRESEAMVFSSWNVVKTRFQGAEAQANGAPAADAGSAAGLQRIGQK
jgi:hypothetical protein